MSIKIETDDGAYISFEDGEISWEAYNSCRDVYEYGELNKENTRKLYEAMKEYFEEK